MPLTFRKQIWLAALPAVAVIIAALLPILKTPPEDSLVVAGTIVDQDQRPLFGADITVSGRAEHYLSESSGNFRIQLRHQPPNQPVRLVVSKPGYLPQNMSVTPPAENQVVQLLNQ
jgi:hypothetical protein